MKAALTLALLLLAHGSAHAGSAFSDTDIGAIRAREARAAEDARLGALRRVFAANQTLLNLIAPFAREHGGLAQEAACNGRPYPLQIGNEPWYDYRPLPSIGAEDVWEIMNCAVTVNDGWQCTLNYYNEMKPESGTPTLVHHG